MTSRPGSVPSELVVKGERDEAKNEATRQLSIASATAKAREELQQDLASLKSKVRALAPMLDDWIGDAPSYDGLRAFRRNLLAAIGEE